MSNSLGEGGSGSVPYSDALSPAVSVSAADGDSFGSDLTAEAVGLPGGLSLAPTSTSADGSLPGTREWTVAGTTTAAPGTYPVTVTVTDQTGLQGSTSFTIDVTQEDAEATYTGDTLLFTGSGGPGTVLLQASVRDSSVLPGSGDTAPGDIRNATVTFMEGADVLCGPLPVTLLNGATTAGTAACSAPLDLGAHTIGVLVHGYYTGEAMAVIDVAEADGSFVSPPESFA